MKKDQTRYQHRMTKLVWGSGIYAFVAAPDLWLNQALQLAWFNGCDSEKQLPL